MEFNFNVVTPYDHANFIHHNLGGNGGGNSVSESPDNKTCGISFILTSIGSFPEVHDIEVINFIRGL